MLQAAEFENQSRLSPLTSDMALENLMFALLFFSLVLVQYFLVITLFFSFWNSNIYSVPLFV